ncbi:MAG: hypothetical protein OXH97_05790 [Chloroflexota bacterium]|nr:hypothetical protein [Chloroflexota bacterium]
MPPSTRRYGSNQRWLMKALREVAHEVGELVSGLPEEALRRRPPGEGLREEWSIVETVGFLRDSEREDLRAVQAMVRRDGARLTERRAHLVPDEGGYAAATVHELVWDFSTLRQELLWELEWAGSAWEHHGAHPYRGEVSLADYVHEINERDLDAMWSLRRLREQAEAPAL